MSELSITLPIKTANYMGGSVSLLPLAENGLFTNNGSDITTVELPFRNGSSPLRVGKFVSRISPIPSFDLPADCFFSSPTGPASRQDGSHPHEVVEVKANGSSEVWVPDLGSDVVWRLQLEENSSPITWKLKVGEELKGDEGGGPRHIIVSEDGQSISHLFVPGRNF
jgi:6-phosphogluconolactonase (cycloisomerase 2 family)